MGRFASGLIAGGALGAIGFALAASDKRTRKRMMNDSRKVIRKLSH